MVKRMFGSRFYVIVWIYGSFLFGTLMMTTTTTTTASSVSPPSPRIQDRSFFRWSFFKNSTTDDNTNTTTTVEEIKEEKQEDKSQQQDQEKQGDPTMESKQKQQVRRGPFGFFKPLEDIITKGRSTTTTSGVEDTNEEEDSEEEEKQEEDLTTNVTSTSTDAGTNVTTHNSTGEEDSNTIPSNSTTTTAVTTPDNSTLSKPRYVLLGRSPMALPPQQHSMMMIPPNSIMLPPPPLGANPGAPFGPSPTMDNHHRLILAGISSTIAAFSRLWLLLWVIKRLTEEDEFLSPRQHFRWECLNDKYSKDQSVLNRVLATPSLSFSRLSWWKYLKSLKSKKKGSNELSKQETTTMTTPFSSPRIPTKTVIVVDLAPSGQIDVEYITNVVNFLLAAHSKRQLGMSENLPEVILLVESPGGGVSKFGLAAAQIRRLKTEEPIGWNVTICVDEIAASGGYMIASQATTLLAAPFAQIGSIGVIVEGLNFNKLLTKYGVQPMVLKAGDSKNRLSTYGPVTDIDLEDETKRLENIHQAFIDLCLRERPNLDPTICDGTVMVAIEGLSYGMVDRIITSEEYIWECIQQGALVLKLRRASDVHPNFALFQVLNLLPHLKQKFRQHINGSDGKKWLSIVLQGFAIGQMILRSIR